MGGWLDKTEIKASLAPQLSWGWGLGLSLAKIYFQPLGNHEISYKYLQFQKKRKCALHRIYWLISIEY